MTKPIVSVLALWIAMLPSQIFALDINHPLPNWLDSSREQVKTSNFPLPTRATPPSDMRFPAEYEPIAAVVISWAGYTDMLTAIAKGVIGPANAYIWAASGPASIPGVPAEKYTRINAPVDTVWTRDYGPFGLSAGQKKLGIVDTVYRHYQYRTDDDAFPSRLGQIKKVDVYGVQLILDGGNMMMDSKGNLFMTKRTYLWNSSMSAEQVDSLLKSYYKAKNIYTFEYSGYPKEPADGTGHIDMFMKLLNDHTVLISTADKDPFKSNAEKAMAFFKGKTAPDGQPYKIITVKGWTNSRAWYTYTNSLIVNNVVLMPTYSGHSQENDAAKAAYESGMPGVKVVYIPADQSIVDGGAVHCVTQTIPVLPPDNKDTTLNMTAEDLKDFTAREDLTSLKQLKDIANK